MCIDLQTKHLYTSRHVLFNKSKFPFLHFQQSNSIPFTPKPVLDIWLSNLLYLHSSNQPSILDSYVPSNSNLTTLNPPYTPNPSSTNPNPISTSHSSCQPSTSASHNISFTPSVSPNPPQPSTTSVSHNPIPLANTNPVLPLVTNTYPMTTRSKNSITKPKLCFKAVLDYIYTEPPSYRIAS